MTRGKDHKAPSVLGFAIMQLLTRSRESGYDLKKRFHSTVGHGWHAYDTQIYRELRSMEANGYIKGEAAKGLAGPERRIYTVTRAGHKALVDWLTSPLDLTRTKDEFALRVWTADLFPGDAFLDFLEDAITETRGMLDAARAARAHLTRSYGDVRDAPAEVFGRLLAIDLTISKHESWIAWAERAVKVTGARQEHGQG